MGNAVPNFMESYHLIILVLPAEKLGTARIFPPLTSLVCSWWWNKVSWWASLVQNLKSIYQFLHTNNSKWHNINNFFKINYKNFTGLFILAFFFQLIWQKSAMLDFNVYFKNRSTGMILVDLTSSPICSGSAVNSNLIV